MIAFLKGEDLHKHLAGTVIDKHLDRVLEEERQALVEIHQLV